MQAATHEDRILDIIRQVQPLYAESSLAAGLEALRRIDTEVVPVVEGAYLVGALWSGDGRSALLAGEPLSMPVSDFVDRSPLMLRSSASREEARAALAASGRPAALVVDSEGRYLGVLRALDLLQSADRTARPPLVGGMATPMGVYLTNGNLRAGAGPLALLLTGVVLSLMLLAAVLVTGALLEGIPRSTPAWLQASIFHLAPLALFFLQIRLSPIAATHGAEHMVVHAIERGEALRPEIVVRMPRVHPRCGTNLAIGAMLFTGIMQYAWPTMGEAGALLALVVTIVAWRPLGNLAQRYITTKTPRDKDIASAIAAATDLLNQYRASDRTPPPIATRLWASGLPLILVGSMAVMWVAPYVLSLLGVSERVLQYLI